MNKLLTSSTTPLLETRNLGKVYQEGKLQTQVLHNINFRLDAGSLMAIVGSSGSGKSTLLHLLGALDQPSSGEVLFQGQSINQLTEPQRAAWRNQQIGFIYQFHHLLPDFNAIENVAMPLLINGINPKEAEKRAREMLAQVELSHRATHRPSEMSGGERQRVAISRALINQPALVMADEPTGNLDQRTAESVFELLVNLNRQQGTAFLVVTHDLNLANKLEQQLEMQNGQLVEVTPACDNH